jgi:hypothetical protein
MESRAAALPRCERPVPVTVQRRQQPLLVDHAFVVVDASARARRDDFGELALHPQCFEREVIHAFRAVQNFQSASVVRHARHLAAAVLPDVLNQSHGMSSLCGVFSRAGVQTRTRGPSLSSGL